MVDDLTLLAQKMIDLAISIQQIPAPTFDEQKRSVFIKEQFERRALADIKVDEAGNVFARLQGKRNLPTAVFSAHLDTVFPAGSDLSIRYDGDLIYGPGIGDNALGVAGLLALVDALRLSDRLAGDIWLAANVCEEGLGDLMGMKAVVERFGSDVLAYVVVEGTTLDKIYHRAVGVERYRIEAKTPGGHSWSSFGKPSAIHELARLVSQISQLDIPSQPRTTWNVGMFRGGMSINTIAPEAQMEIDLRSENTEVLAELVERVQRLVREANRDGADFVNVQAEMIGQRPAGEIPEDHPLVKLACKCLEEQGITPILGIGSTDANLPLSKGLPAVCVGLTRGGGSHTLNEMIQTQPATQGLRMLKSLAEGIFREQKP